MHKHIVSKFVARLFAALLAVAALSAPIAGAQTAVLKVNVPFTFESGTTHFAPGVYNIYLSSATPNIRIEGDKSSAFQMTMAGSSDQAPGVSKVVFHQLGSRYILKEVRVAGRKEYVSTPWSKVEKEWERAQTSNGNKQTYLALLATPR